jgi:hypothetical protein
MVRDVRTRGKAVVPSPRDNPDMMLRDIPYWEYQAISFTDECSFDV